MSLDNGINEMSDDSDIVSPDHLERSICDRCQLDMHDIDHEFYGCDWCDSLLCDECQDILDIYYYSCEECGAHWCYHGDIRCFYRSSSGCANCGN